MKTHEFRGNLIRALLLDTQARQSRNTDTFRFPSDVKSRVLCSLTGRALDLLKPLGLTLRNPRIVESADALCHTVEHLAWLEQFHALLADEASRQMLVELLRYRVLGSRHVKLSTNNERYWRLARAVEGRYRKAKRVATVGTWPLDRYELPGTRGPLVLEAHPMNILNTFLLEQYAYRVGSARVQAMPGETVIDAGGCWGDTALYFSDRVGATGAVHVFEFCRANLDVLRRNLKLNPALAPAVHLYEQAVWDESSQTIDYSEDGPGTRLHAPSSTGTTDRTVTVTIDDFVRHNALSRVDLIKMDIEGAEAPALRGAVETLRAFRPKLAISLYHRPDDFVVIPRHLAGLDLGYQWFLGHATIHHEETVLFGSPPGRKVTDIAVPRPRISRS